MKIAFVSSEVEPFAKTGGLGDVAGALPKALKNLGHDVKVFMPKYALVDHSKFDLDYDWSIGEIPIRVAGNVYNVNVYHSTLPTCSSPSCTARAPRNAAPRRACRACP